MCTYCTTNNYRKIYENHVGPIGKDADGRSLEIHHINGDHLDNRPENFKLVTIHEHYNIHYSQGDYGACFMMMSERMNFTPEEISQAATLHNLNRVKNGTHPFLGGKVQRQSNKERIDNGTHNFLDSNAQSAIATKRNADQLANNTHNLQKIKTCPHCGATENLMLYSRYHGDNCILVNPSRPKIVRDLSKNKECPHCTKVIDPQNYAKYHGDKCKLLLA